jgi:Omp85 superfamily domain
VLPQFPALPDCAWAQRVGDFFHCAPRPQGRGVLSKRRDSFITLKLASGDLPPIPPDVGVTTNLLALGVEVYRDSRANRFYPLQGSVIDFTGDRFMQGLGSRYSFQSYKFTFNKYWSLSDKQVLAYNLYWCGTGGSPPFYGNCIYSLSEELRGYTAGRYLDRYMLATQSMANQPILARRGHRRSLHAEQEISRQFASRLRMGQR